MLLAVLRDRDLVPPVKKGGGSKRILPAIIIALFLGFGARQITHTFLFLPVETTGADMEPGLKAGETVHINRLTGPGDFQRGDLVLLRHPRSPDYRMIRRVVALPGETVQLYNGRLFVNDREITEAWETRLHANEAPASLPLSVARRDNTEKITVKAAELFVLGDNRDRALDSRLLGAIPLKFVEGRVFHF